MKFTYNVSAKTGIVTGHILLDCIYFINLPYILYHVTRVTQRAASMSAPKPASEQSGQPDKKVVYPYRL